MAVGDVGLGFYLLDRRSIPGNEHAFVRLNNKEPTPRYGASHRSHFHVRIHCADDDHPMYEDRPPFLSGHQRADEAPAVATLKTNES